jgi:hypothetical protein
MTAEEFANIRPGDCVRWIAPEGETLRKESLGSLIFGSSIGRVVSKFEDRLVVEVLCCKMFKGNGPFRGNAHFSRFAVVEEEVPLFV